LSLRNQSKHRGFKEEEINMEAQKEFETIISSKYIIPKEKNMRAQMYPTATSEQNINKNRFHNVLATEHSRVILQERDSSENYINANRISFPAIEKEIIVTQSPLQDTVEDFYQMIWQEGSHVILCLTPETQNGSNLEECISNSQMEENKETKKMRGTLRYYPSGLVTVLSTENFQIKLLNSSSSEDLDIRILLLFNQQTATSRKIVHIQYKSWVDFGVPKNQNDIFQLISLTNFYQKSLRTDERNPNNPIVCHCSAGLGRSGLFVSIFVAIEMLLKGKVSPINLNIPKMVLSVRSQRNGCIQNEKQYAFIYLALNLFVSNMRKKASKKKEESVEMDVSN